MYSKPQPGDYPPYYENYFVQLPQVPVLELLNQQPAALVKLVTGLSNRLKRLMQQVNGIPNRY
jgi:hypothetical protein